MNLRHTGTRRPARQRFLQISLLMSAVFLAVPAYAAPTRIICEADRHTYNSRQGNVDESTGTIVIDLDDAAQTVTVANSGYVLAPHVPGMQTTLQVTRYDSTEIDFHVSYSCDDANSCGNMNYEHYATINRLTGDFTATLTVNGAHPSVYSGTCTKAQQQF